TSRHLRVEQRRDLARPLVTPRAPGPAPVRVGGQMVGSDLREGTAVVNSPTAGSTAVHQVAGSVLPVAHHSLTGINSPANSSSPLIPTSGARGLAGSPSQWTTLTNDSASSL